MIRFSLFRGFTARLSIAVVAMSLGGAALAGLNYDSDVPQAVKAQMEQDLQFVVGLQGSRVGQYYQQIFSDSILQGSTLAHFFEQRIFSVGLDSCGSPYAAACVQPGFDSNKMWLTNTFVTANIPQIFRLSIVFHESRHSEDANGNWSHAICPTPYKDEQGKDIVGIVTGAKMAGQPACDTTALGSYGLQAVLLKTVQTACTNCNQKVQMDAKIYGDDTLNRISVLALRQAMRNDLQK